jgi:ABC-2 type transport system ATP-binding protein
MNSSPSNRPRVAEYEPAPSSGDTMIEAAGLSKYYGHFAACRDVTFSINKGEVCAFLGPNGAGRRRRR